MTLENDHAAHVSCSRFGLPQRDRGRAIRDSDRRLPAIAGARASPGCDWIPLGPLTDFPGRSDAAGRVCQPVQESHGTARPPRSRAGCGARGRRVPGLRDQLHASRMPGALVRRIRTVHVPVPWRRLLRRRRARLGSAAARPVSIRIQGRRRAALDQRRPIADAGPAVQAHDRRAAQASDRRDGSTQRLQVGEHDRRGRRASGAAQLGELVVRLRQRHAGRASFCRSSPASAWRLSVRPPPTAPGTA